MANKKATDWLDCVHEKERAALRALVEVYGDDVSTILNGLHALSVRLAIIADVSADDFAAGMKAHWDFIANAINESQQHQRQN